MAQNTIDYDILSDGAASYGKQASLLDDIITELDSKNGQIQEGWVNETARAFIERYESEFKPALKNTRDAIDSISKYITSYVQNEQAHDSENASHL